MICFCRFDWTISYVCLLKDIWIKGWLFAPSFLLPSSLLSIILSFLPSLMPSCLLSKPVTAREFSLYGSSWEGLPIFLFVTWLLSLKGIKEKGKSLEKKATLLMYQSFSWLAETWGASLLTAFSYVHHLHITRESCSARNCWSGVRPCVFIVQGGIGFKLSFSPGRI